MPGGWRITFMPPIPHNPRSLVKRLDGTLRADYEHQRDAASPRPAWRAALMFAAVVALAAVVWFPIGGAQEAAGRTLRSQARAMGTGYAQAVGRGGPRTALAS